MRTDKPLQTAVGLGLLITGLGFYVAHMIRHPAVTSLDGDVKIALGIAGVGLLLLPFDFTNVRAVASRRASGLFKAPSGVDGPKSGDS